MILTIIIISLFLITLIWLIIAHHSTRYITDEVAFVLTWIFGIAVVVYFITMPIIRAQHRLKMKVFEATRATILQQRSIKSTEYERMKLTEKIIEKNEWLAEAQFCAKGKWINWHYPKEILDLKPIE